MIKVLDIRISGNIHPSIFPLTGAGVKQGPQSSLTPDTASFSGHGAVAQSVLLLGNTSPVRPNRSLDVEEQQLYSELLLGDQAPHPVSKGAPSHPDLVLQD